MKKVGKRYQNWAKHFRQKSSYNPEEVVQILTQHPLEKFHASVDLVFHLNLNTKKPEHTLKGYLDLPHPIVKPRKICVFTERFGHEASKHEPFLLGGKDLVAQIAKEQTINFDLVLATAEMMKELNKIGKLLGGKKLMPNKKMGTLVEDLETALVAWKKGRSTYHSDNLGNLHLVIGKTNFSATKLLANFHHCLHYIAQIKPVGVKGKYIKSIHISTSMGPGFPVNLR